MDLNGVFKLFLVAFYFGVKLHALKNVFPRQREKPEMPSIAWFISSLFDKGTEKIPKKPKFTGYNVPLDPRTLTESEIVFVMDATKIRILEQPKDFHEALLVSYEVIVKPICM